MRSGFLLVVLALLSSVAQAQELPRDLRRIRDQVGCSPVEDFYERGGMVEPPFVYGVFPGFKDATAAFLCQRGSGKRKLLLIVVEKGEVSAQLELRDFMGQIGGLSIFEGPADLKIFRRLEDGQPYGGTGSTEYPPLRYGDDGLSVLYYRLDGKWLYAELD